MAQETRFARLREVVSLYGYLGLIGFGGPVAHIAMMEQATVNQRGWLTRQRFLDGIAVTNLVPGPNSTEMAIHIGHLRAGVLGGIGAGLAFILPAFFMMLALSWAYFEWQTTPALNDAFYGVKAAVLALILVAVYRLFLTGVGDPRLLRAGAGDFRLVAIFATALGLGLIFPGYEIAIILGAGLIGFVFYGPALRPSSGSAAVIFLIAAPALAWEPDTLLDLFVLCVRTGGLLFGGGYVMIPLLEDPVVEQFGWLTREQFLDGVALGQTTPGPIVITATFIGYGAAGLAGAAVATFAIFLPAFFFAVLTSRLIHTFGEAVWVKAALKGIAAAVVGTILAATIRLADAAFVDALAVVIAVVSLILLLRFRLNTLLLVGGGALSGLALGPVR